MCKQSSQPNPTQPAVILLNIRLQQKREMFAMLCCLYTALRFSKSDFTSTYNPFIRSWVTHSLRFLSYNLLPWPRLLHFCNTKCDAAFCHCYSSSLTALAESPKTGSPKNKISISLPSQSSLSCLKLWKGMMGWNWLVFVSPAGLRVNVSSCGKC